MTFPRFRYRLYILTVMILAGTGVLLSKLYNIQINKKEYYSDLLPKNHEVNIREPGIRGIIYDRNGVKLAGNQRNYEITFNLEEVMLAYERWEREEKKNTSDKLLKKDQKKDIPKLSINEVVNQWLRPKLKVHNLDIDTENLPGLKAHYATHGGLIPYSFRADLSYDAFAHAAEYNLDLPGVYINVRPRRVYPLGALASHVIGYVKEWHKGDIPPGFKHYIGDEKGDAGVELTMNRYLQGTEGTKNILRDEKGNYLRLLDHKRSGSGADVKLTLDARAQYLAETALKYTGRSAAVVMDPNTGEVLAMASMPDFLPNDFIPRISLKKQSEYNANRKAAPFENKAIGTFTPGSTFKLPTAVAGCIHNKSDVHVNCVGYMQYGKVKIGCWKKHGHGNLGLAEAIQRSCNPYFMQVANLLGTKTLVKEMSTLGFGSRTGIRLPGETSGILPGNINWKRKNRGRVMTPALTGMITIGQGDCEASPLQLASFVSAIANRGLLYQPRIIKEVTHPLYGTQITDKPKIQQNLLKNGLSIEDLEVIRKGMWFAATKTGGTARRASPQGIEIAAKTGTAQTFDQGIKTHVSWTVAFAPYDNPRYVVAVAVRRGDSGGKVAGPIVRMILEGLFAMEKGYKIPLKKTTPSKGNFDLISEIKVPEENLLESLFHPRPEELDEEQRITIIPTETDEETPVRAVPVNPFRSAIKVKPNTN